MMPLHLWLLALCVAQWHGATVAATIDDRYPHIPNAFTTTSTGAAVRAVYEASQLTWTNTTTSVLTPFQSSNYVLCQQVASSAASSADANTAAIVASWCTSGFGGNLVSQTVLWSTLAAPGLQLLDQSANSYQARAWDCLTYACDTENTISTRTKGASAAAPASLGGLSVSTPCCGSTNSTFVLYNTRGVVVQANMLPVTAMNNEALLLAEAYAADQASREALSSSASSATGDAAASPSHPTLPLLNLSGNMDYCLIRQLSPSFYDSGVEGYAHDNSSHGGVGDGGVVLPVNVSICGNDLSDRIDTRRASLEMTGYNLVLATADGLDELSMPRELIESVAAWIARAAGTAAGTYTASNSLARTKDDCVWRYNVSYATAYRTGEFYECVLSDPRLLHHLPPLLLSVRNESIVNTEETNSSCSIAIDLRSSAVSPRGSKLRFFSTGSMMQQLSLRHEAMALFENPPIVVGMQHLRGATVALTRAAHIKKWNSFGFNLATGLPLLYLAIPRGASIVSHVAATSWYACVQPQTCGRQQIFYPSLNQCATKECVNLFMYYFNADTFECTVRVSTVALFAAMCFVLLVAEATVLYLRCSTEEAKEEHMRLVHAVQRREAGTH